MRPRSSAATPLAGRASRMTEDVHLMVSHTLTYSPALKRGDSFAVARMERCATLEMRMVPHSGGGRHNPYYQAGARIRPADIDRTNTVPMEQEGAQRVATP